MFRNRALQISFVKKGATNETPTTVVRTLDMDQVDEIVQIAMYHADHASRIIMGAYFAKKFIDTACTIAIIAASSKMQ